MINTKTEELLQRRSNIVPDGVGIFVRSTSAEGRGSTIIDADGNEFIDFGGGIGVLNAGYCPEPVVQAIHNQAQKLIHSCFHISTYEPYLELCEKLAEILPHGNETKVMLTDTGAESVENAIKIARQATKRQAVLCYTDAFHGRSMMAMTLTSKIDYKIGSGPFAPEVYRLPFPNFYRYGDGQTEERFVENELKRLWGSAKNLVDPYNVAAVIIELVQGEGGFNCAPQKYVEGLRKFCDEFGIVLIVDEVQTGFGRTAKWGAFQHYNITPDISTWAKSLGSGMPIGAVIGKKEIMDAAKPGTIGGTFLGNPVCCAAAIATLQYMKDININEKALHVSNIVAEHFGKLKEKYPAIGDIRGLGAMQAIEFVKNGNPRMPDSDTCAKLMTACLSRGLILLSAGTHKNIIRVLSPLVISDELLIRGLNIIDEELEKIFKQ